MSGEGQSNQPPTQLLGMRTLPKRIQSFLLCVLCQVVLPLFPLIGEKVLTGEVKPRSVGLLSGLFVISLGLGTTTTIVWVAGIAVGLLLTATCGMSEPQAGVVVKYPNFPYYLTIPMVLAFLIDRGYHHLVKGRAFPPIEKEE